MKTTKRTLTMVVALLLCFATVLTGCNSEEDNPTPVSTDCPHVWNAATCMTPKICSACGATEGTALGHSWVEATCTTPKTCSACGAREGDVIPHTFAAGKCSVCGEVDKNSDEYKYALLKKKADNLVSSCARTAVRNQLKNPSSMKVLTEEILDSDNYFRYSVHIKYTAENSFGGTVTDDAYILVRVKPVMDGTFAYRMGSQKTDFGWGTEPEDWSLDAVDKYINPTEVSIKLLIANPSAYKGQYVKIQEQLTLYDNDLSRKSFDVNLSGNYNVAIEVFYKLCDNVDELIMLEAKYQKITVIGEVKVYSDSNEAYIDASEIIFH